MGIHRRVDLVIIERGSRRAPSLVRKISSVLAGGIPGKKKVSQGRFQGDEGENPPKKNLKRKLRKMVFTKKMDKKNVTVGVQTAARVTENCQS